MAGFLPQASRRNLTDREVHAVRVATRFADARAMFRLEEAEVLLADDVVFIALDNVVYGRENARLAMLDQARFRNINRFFDEWAVRPSPNFDLVLSLDVSGGVSAAATSAHDVNGFSPMGAAASSGTTGDVIVVERVGRMYRSLQYIDLRFFYVRETVVIDTDGRIRMFALQRRV